MLAAGPAATDGRTGDVELVELRHKHKRDAPSGTTLRLIEGLGPRVDGRTGPRIPGEIGVHAVRGATEGAGTSVPLNPPRADSGRGQGAWGIGRRITTTTAPG